MSARRGVTALAVAMLIAPSSFAQPSGVNAVDVAIAADDEADGQAMKAVVTELIARLHLAATVTFVSSVDQANVIAPQASVEPRVARAWIDLSEPERATLYLVDRNWERILIRHVQKTQSHDELAREAIGHILETAVDALAHGGTIGVAPDETRPPTEGAQSPPPTPPRWELGALYEGEVYAPRGLIANGPEATFYIGARRAAVRPGAWLTGQYRLPIILDAAPIGVRLDGAALRALATVDITVNARLAVRLGVGLGLDAVHMTPRLEGQQGTMLGQDEEFALIVARASAGAVWWVARDLGIALTLSCDVDPSGTRYSAVVDRVEETTLSPWPVRPAISLGVLTQ
jgi:hypothetical protein